MQHQLVRAGGVTYIEIIAAPQPLGSEQDALELVGLSWAEGATRLLLHPSVLADAFFQLRSGVAGAMIQKFATYQLRVAATVPDQAGWSPRFRELVAETNRGQTFGVFGTRAEAERWLLHS